MEVHRHKEKKRQEKIDKINIKVHIKISGPTFSHRYKERCRKELSRRELRSFLN